MITIGAPMLVEVGICTKTVGVALTEHQNTTAVASTLPPLEGTEGSLRMLVEAEMRAMVEGVSPGEPPEYTWTVACNFFGMWRPPGWAIFSRFLFAPHSCNIFRWWVGMRISTGLAGGT